MVSRAVAAPPGGHPARGPGRAGDVLGSGAVTDASATAGPSLRDQGLRIGALPTGPANAITDVADVRVGHMTVVRDEAPPPAGRGVARTGVTAIVPRAPETLLARPVLAGAAVLNGAGEMTSFLQVSEWGVIETPVYLTATMAVGRVYDGAIAAAAAADARVGPDNVVIPAVAECDDSWLCDAFPIQVDAADAGRALAAAADGPVAQGAVGSGTGMICFGWKGGIGTSSRVVADRGVSVGVLVMANFGSWPDLRVGGVPVGLALGRGGEVAEPGGEPPEPGGSCIAVVATDAPLNTTQLQRVARRAGLGLARTGSVAHHGSGEIFLALAVGDTDGAVPDGDLDAIFSATVDAAEEAVLNALWFAEDTTGRVGRVVRALPHDAVLELLSAHRRLEP
jgi:D-aminopeptidase